MGIDMLDLTFRLEKRFHIKYKRAWLAYEGSKWNDAATWGRKEWEALTIADLVDLVHGYLQSSDSDVPVEVRALSREQVRTIVREALGETVGINLEKKNVPDTARLMPDLGFR